jgi:hypothetical protein
MGIDNGPADRQPHPHAAGLRCVEDKSSSLSATVNKFLRLNGLRPTRDHSVYSLRHSFKDRLVAAEAPDSLIDSLMVTRPTSQGTAKAHRWN